MAEKTVFEDLFSVNVNDHVEKKNTGKVSLSYLSWAWAWAEIKKRYPDANYEIKMFDNLPYSYDAKTGYMVYTTVTINGVSHMMWLPVMDSHNEAMLDHSRVVKTKYSEYTVEACTMFDVNKTIMRCLTKNLAMFGLGLYIYAGEDLPEESDEDKAQKEAEFTALAEKANGFISSLSDTEKKKVQFYIDNKDMEGLKRFITYCESKKEKIA